MADNGFCEGCRITMEELPEQTGVHRTTLSKTANQKSYVTNTSVLDQLCAYFQVTTNEVAEYVPDEEAQDEIVDTQENT